MQLNEIRERIDSLDRELLKLFEERMELCGKVAAYKQENNLDIFVPARETEIMNQVRREAKHGMEPYDSRLFEQLLTLSREYQAELLHQDPPPFMPVHLRTERLILEPLDKMAAPAVFSLTSDPEVAKYMHFDTHTDISQTEKLIADLTSGSNLSYVILTENREFVGIYALKPNEDNPARITMSVFLGKKHWGKGYCSELLAKAIEVAEKYLHAEALGAYVVSRNKASCRVLEKQGFTVETEFSFHDLDGSVRLYTLKLPHNA